MPKKFWFHEDDFQQVQFLDFRCWDFCLYHLDQIRRHGEDHRAPDGIGWTKMYPVPAAPFTIGDLSISVGNLVAAMPWRLRRTNNVLSGGWSEQGERQDRTAAYMAGPSAIVFNWTEDRIVDSLWFHGGYVSRWWRGPLLEALFRIGILSPMLLVDWRGILVDLGDRKAIGEFLTPSESTGHNFDGDAKDIEISTGSRSINSEIAKQPGSVTADTPPPLRAGSLYRFDTPVHPELVTRKFKSGPVHAILNSTDGKCWSISIDKSSSNAVQHASQMPIKATRDTVEIEWKDMAGGKAIAFCDAEYKEWHDIYDVHSGGAILEKLETESVVLSPDGNYVLLFEDDGIAVADLRQPELPARKSGLFPNPYYDSNDHPERWDRTLDHPESIMAVAASTDPNTFTLAIGDYGFAVVAEVRLGGVDEAPLIMMESAHAFSEGLVYDPVEIIDILPGKTLVVRHGYGSGITIFDLQTGEENSCPLPAETPEPRYGAFQRAVLSSGLPGLWVQTDTGSFYWNGTDSLASVPENARELLATDGDSYIGISPDGWDLIGGRILSEP